jgi:hypothetical protein
LSSNVGPWLPEPVVDTALAPDSRTELAEDLSIALLLILDQLSPLQFLVDATRKRPGAWWREDFILRFATINGLPGLIMDAPEAPVQTAAFEIEGDVIGAVRGAQSGQATPLGAGATRERSPVDSSCGNAPRERHRAGSRGRISSDGSVYR